MANKIVCNNVEYGTGGVEYVQPITSGSISEDLYLTGVRVGSYIYFCIPWPMALGKVTSVEISQINVSFNGTTTSYPSTDYDFAIVATPKQTGLYMRVGNNTSGWTQDTRNAVGLWVNFTLNFD